MSDDTNGSSQKQQASPEAQQEWKVGNTVTIRPTRMEVFGATTSEQELPPGVKPSPHAEYDRGFSDGWNRCEERMATPPSAPQAAGAVLNTIDTQRVRNAFPGAFSSDGTTVQQAAKPNDAVMRLGEICTPACNAEFGDPREPMDETELQEFCIALSFEQDDYTVEVIRAVEDRMMAKPLFVPSAIAIAQGTTPAAGDGDYYSEEADDISQSAAGVGEQATGAISDERIAETEGVNRAFDTFAETADFGNKVACVRAILAEAGIKEKTNG